MLELYQAGPVANAMRPLSCRKDKQQVFVCHYETLLQPGQHSPAFVKPDPGGQVLVHDVAATTESTVKNATPDEKKPASALAKNPPGSSWSEYRNRSLTGKDRDADAVADGRMARRARGA